MAAEKRRDLVGKRRDLVGKTRYARLYESEDGAHNVHLSLCATTCARGLISNPLPLLRFRPIEQHAHRFRAVCQKHREGAGGFRIVEAVSYQIADVHLAAL